MKTAVHNTNVAAEIVDILASFGVKAVQLPAPTGAVVETLDNHQIAAQIFPLRKWVDS